MELASNKEDPNGILRSQFFQSDFNTAIFDGGLKIYFSHQMESEALKFYFELQEKLAEPLRSVRHLRNENRKTLFVFLYPAEKSFESVGGEDSYFTSSFGKDHVVGLLSEDWEERQQQIFLDIAELFSQWSGETVTA